MSQVGMTPVRHTRWWREVALIVVFYSIYTKVRNQFGSATLRPDSPHYAVQAPLLAARQLKPVWLDEADIRAHLEQEYLPGQEP